MANVQESLVKVSLQDSPKKDIIQRLKGLKIEDELSWLKYVVSEIL
jgi:hypothetical protein